MQNRYDPQAYESRWMEQWESSQIYAAPDMPSGRSKFFIMEMFPYPSGDLHMGHVENYSIADAMARYARMRGHEVMHPMGYDAFGLPAENAAMKRNVHPRSWTLGNIEQMRSSFKRLGYSYDWDREVISCDPDYYKWNQWIFLKMYERGLAYRATSTVNWCPVDKTVLAKEQLSTGVCWRCGSEPEVRDLTQWFLKITDYSDRLLDDMEGLRWSDSILNQQRNWIGRSRGAEVVFRIEPENGVDPFDVTVFTTRPDTLWGATFMVFAPEHPLIADMVKGTPVEEPFDAFFQEVKRSDEVERMAGEGMRKGIALPASAINPVNGERIPVWAADYVLMGYGTGAIMAVPAHDQRDFEFAKQHGLEVRVVVQPEGQDLEASTMTEAYPATGVMVNSGPFTGTVVDPESKQGIEEVIAWLQSEAKGTPSVHYRQRDWLVSRQRYWGTPIPIVHCPDCGEVPVPYEDLPVRLPDEIDYSIEIEGVASPLAAVAEFVNVKCPNCGGAARRETDTLDTFFDSSWYFLRYCDPNNDQEPFAPEKVAAWCPVDQYVGGTEHAVMHLIYARFFIKVFQDMGLLGFPEPFLSLFNQGSISVEGREMSKSAGNAIEAAQVIERYGADTARVFILFCSPPDADYDFPADGMEEIGRVAHSWLSRVWRVLGEVEEGPVPDDLNVVLHRTVKGVTEDFEDFGFNTAIAKLMELINEFSRRDGPVPRAAAETALKLLAPIAPFIAEELWHRYGNEGSIHTESWPGFDAQLVASEKVTMVIQVNGKVRDKVEVDPQISEEEMKRVALGSERVLAHLAGAEPARVITVPPRLVNIVR